MARIRTIKPDFWTDEKLAECSRDARLLFIGTWNFADDEGRMEYNPKRLKMQVFPGDIIEVASLVEELKRHALVIVYRVGHRDFLAIPNFKKHQRVDHPKASVIPAPVQEDSLKDLRSVLKDSVNDPQTLAPEGNGMEWNGINTLRPNNLVQTCGRLQDQNRRSRYRKRRASLHSFSKLKFSTTNPTIESLPPKNANGHKQRTG